MKTLQILQAATAVLVISTATWTCAKPLPDTPQNEAEVREALPRMLAPLGVTDDMIEQVSQCVYKVKRPQFDFSRIIDLRQLDNVVAGSRYLTDNEPRPDDLNIYMKADENSPYNVRVRLWCKQGGAEAAGDDRPYSCEDAIIVEGANVRQFIEAYQGAAPIVAICNPTAAYKPCGTGLFQGFKCAQ